MQSDRASLIPIYSASLSSLDKAQLIDLLQHKTQLLITARLAAIADIKYIESLRKEVIDLQTEIKKRID